MKSKSGSSQTASKLHAPALSFPAQASLREAEALLWVLCWQGQVEGVLVYRQLLFVEKAPLLAFPIVPPSAAGSPGTSVYNLLLLLSGLAALQGT